MHECSILFQDITTLHGKLELVPRDPFGVLETINISREFWSRLGHEDQFNLPTVFEEHIDSFSNAFERVKDPDRFRWQHGHSAESILLRFEDVHSTDVMETPIQAAILLRLA